MLPILGFAPNEFVNPAIARRMAVLTLPSHPYHEINHGGFLFCNTTCKKCLRKFYPGLSPGIRALMESGLSSLLLKNEKSARLSKIEEKNFKERHIEIKLLFLYLLLTTRCYLLISSILFKGANAFLISSAFIVISGFLSFMQRYNFSSVFNFI